MSDSESVFSTDEFEFDEPEEIQDFEDVDDDAEQTGNLADESQHPTEDSNVSLQQQAMTPEEKRQARRDQKEARMTRRLLKPHADIIEQSKKIWEQIRSKSTTKKNKQELMSKLMDLVKGKAIDIIFKHDASRIIQFCLKHGNSDQRDCLALELEPKYTLLCQSKYGRFVVSKILKYCSPQRRLAVIRSFHGKVRKCVRHKEASIILDEAYSQYANSSQKMSLMEEFYGPEYAVFKNDNGPSSLDKLIEQFPLKKPSILKHMRAALDAVLEKASFNVGRTPILHRAILAYLTVADKSVFKDMIELLKDHLVHMLHTREGAKVTQLCLLHGSPKDRKNIVKTFKTFVQAISKEQYGHAVLITCFECIDDTVLISKVILAELFSEHVGQLLRDVYGSRVVLYLLKGRDKRYQPQYMIQELEAMDRIRAETTKKTHDARWQQNLDAAIPTLSPHVAHYGGELMRSKQGSTVLIETCKVAGNGTEKILDSIIADISASETSSFKPHEPINVIKKMKKARDVARKLEQGIDYAEPLLSNRFSTLALKTLLVPCKGEPDSEWKVSFREKMWNVINPRYCELLELCSSNPVGTAGLAFILVALYENGTDTIKKQMKTDSKSIKKSLIDKVKNHPLPENELKRKHENQTGIEILLSQL